MNETSNPQSEPESPPEPPPGDESPPSRGLPASPLWLRLLVPVGTFALGMVIMYGLLVVVAGYGAPDETTRDAMMIVEATAAPELEADQVSCLELIAYDEFHSETTWGLQNGMDTLADRFNEVAFDFALAETEEWQTGAFGALDQIEDHATNLRAEPIPASVDAVLRPLVFQISGVYSKIASDTRRGLVSDDFPLILSVVDYVTASAPIVESSRTAITNHLSQIRRDNCH